MMGASIAGRLLDGGGAPAFRDKHDLGLFGVNCVRRIVMPTFTGCLIDGNARHVGQIALAIASAT